MTSTRAAALTRRRKFQQAGPRRGAECDGRAFTETSSDMMPPPTKVERGLKRQVRCGRSQRAFRRRTLRTHRCWTEVRLPLPASGCPVLVHHDIVSCMWLKVRHQSPAPGTARSRPTRSVRARLSTLLHRDKVSSLLTAGLGCRGLWLTKPLPRRQWQPTDRRGVGLLKRGGSIIRRWTSVFAAADVLCDSTV